MMYLFRLFTLLFSLIMLSKCSDNGSEPPQQSDCEGIFCTQEFRMISVTVENENGEAVLLDSHTVTDLKDNEQLSFDQSVETEGTYLIYSDKYADAHQNTNRTLVFEGMLNGAVVVSQEYQVAADCCHVQLVDGPQTIVIQQ